MVKISKNYEPKLTEKYMCEKHKTFFKKKLAEWKTEITRANNEALYNSSLDDNNAGKIMATTGARGSSLNVGQMAGALGQQSRRQSMSISTITGVWSEGFSQLLGDSSIVLEAQCFAKGVDRRIKSILSPIFLR